MIKLIRLSIALILSCAFSVSSSAEEFGTLVVEPFVITASKIEEPLREAPLTISVIKGSELEKGETLTVEEALRDVPGVDVQRMGSIGEQTGVRLRGSLFNQVLILVDGVEVNSPFDGAFDLGDVLAENIDRIEVVKGPHSALYGSEALGGVIHIITGKGEGPRRLTFLEEGGSLKTFRSLVSGQGSQDSSGFALSLARTESEGNKEIGRDAFSADSFSGRVDISPARGHNLSLITRYTGSKKELGIDNPMSLYLQDMVVRLVRDQNRTLRRGFFLSSINYESHPNSVMGLSVRASWMRAGLDLDNPPDEGVSFTPDVMFMRTDSTRLSGEIQATYTPFKGDIVIGGVDYNGESTYFSDYETLSFISTDLWRYKAALYLQNILRWKGLRADAGGRADVNSVLKRVVLNPRTSLRYRLPWSPTSLRASYAAGLRLPSLKELYFPLVGNPSLRPERSDGYEIGIEHELLGLKAEIVGFIVYYRDLIVQPALRYENADRVSIRGVEGLLHGQPLKLLSVSFGATWQEAVERTLPHVPKFKFVASLELIPAEFLSFAINLNHVGPYPEPYPLIDLNGQIIPSRNPGYTRVDSVISSTILHGAGALELLSLFLKADNLLDEKYAEVGGFPSPPRTFLIGARLII